MKLTSFSSKSPLLFTVIFFILSFSAQLWAEDLTLKEVQKRKAVIDKIKVNHDVIAEKKSPLGTTPLSTMLTMIGYLQANDFENASAYFDFRYLPKEIIGLGKEELIRQLTAVWKQQQILDLSTVSDADTGHLDDGLPHYRDLIGVLESSNGLIPVYLQRVPNDKGQKVWKISNASIAQIPKLWEEFGYHPYAELIGEYLPKFQLFNMHNWQFMSFILIVLSAWYITAFIRWILLVLVERSETYRKTMPRFIRYSVRLFLFFILVQYGVGFLGLSISAKVWLNNGTLSYLAAIFLCLGTIEFSFAFYVSKSLKQKTAIAIIRPLVTIFKIVMVIVIALNWFDDAGFDISAIVTGLGIGSLAVALAAQKTLENIFGAFTLFIARPIKPGDFCKFGEITGTVEEIGLRSTRIRRLNRSVVHVPNSVIASESLVNFTDIDYRRFYKTLRVRLETTPDQIRLLLIELRKLILAHPQVLELENRIRLENIDEDAFIIVVSAYVDTHDLFVYKELEEDLNLRIIEILRDQNVELALPEQYISVESKASPSGEYAMMAQENIANLRKESELPFPNFNDKEVADLKNTLKYP